MAEKGVYGEAPWFDKIVRRPLSHILVLRGTGSSVNNAILNVRRTAPKGRQAIAPSTIAPALFY